VESWYDNRGNTATVRHYPFGVTSIDTSRPPISAYIPAIVIPQAASSPRGFNEVNESLKTTIRPSPAPQAERVHDYSQSIPDKSKLPKTPEEYRLDFLRMKAIEEKDFEKADELGQLLFAEQFKNASPAGRVHMLKKAKEERFIEHFASWDRLEKRFRMEYKGSSSEADKRIRKFREMSWKAFKTQEAKFEELHEELLRREKATAREASLKAELQSLQTLIASGASEAEIEKKTEELALKWKAEDEEKMAIPRAELTK
jgi:hypothetical protein